MWLCCCCGSGKKNESDEGVQSTGMLSQHSNKSGHKDKQKNPDFPAVLVSPKVQNGKTTLPSAYEHKVGNDSSPVRPLSVLKQKSESCESIETLIDPAYLKNVKKYEELTEKYKIVKKLSGGSCAVVLLGMDSNTKACVAIKRQQRQGRRVHRIAREAEMHFSVNGHENVAKLLEVAEGPEEIVLVQEYCSGGELFDAILPEVGCAPNVARAFSLQLLDALHYLHEVCHVAHRDIKPENIMLTADKRTIKVIDFGLAERIRGPRALYKRRVGTVPYMDPCLWAKRSDDGYGDIDVKATDVWAAGVVIFCMLCGRFPWAEATPKSEEFRRYLSGDLDRMPWNRLGLAHVTLLRNLLHPVTPRRFTPRQAREYIVAQWPMMTVAEHKGKVRKELKKLALSGRSVNDVVLESSSRASRTTLTLGSTSTARNSTLGSGVLYTSAQE